MEFNHHVIHHIPTSIFLSVSEPEMSDEITNGAANRLSKQSLVLPYYRG